MAFRKYSKFSFLILLCALFWQPLSLGIVGTIGRLYLYSKKGWHVQYSSLKWTKKGIAIVDLVLDADTFSLKVPEVIASFRKKQIEMFQPRLLLTGTPHWEGENEWMFSVREGVLEGEGIETARFSFESPRHQNPGRLAIEWEQGGLTVDVSPQTEGMTLDARLDQMDPYSLRKWTGDQWKGKFQGDLHLKVLGDDWFVSRGHVEGKEISFDGICEGVEGRVDWEHPSGKKELSEGHLRVVLDTGTVHLARTEWRQIRGELSYLGDTGAKWEWSGFLNQERWRWEGRACFQSVQEKWIETYIRCGAGSITAFGKEVKDHRLWEVSGSAVHPDFVRWLQDLAQYCDPRFNEWSFSEGTIGGSLSFVEQEGKISDWEILDFLGENLQIQGPILSLGCEKGELKEKDYTLQGGMFTLSLPNQKCFTGTGWQGEGKIGEDPSTFSGMIEGCETFLSFGGGIETFQGGVELRGLWNGDLFFEGGWDSKNLHFLISDADIENFRFCAKGSIDRHFRFICQSDRFFGPLDPLLKVLGKDFPLRGRVEAVGSGFSIEGSLANVDWSVEARLEGGQMPLFSTAQLENVEMEFEADPNGLSCYDVKGVFSWEKKLPFYCPILETNGAFDVRLEGEIWDFARLAGKTHEGQVTLDVKKSHLLGIPIAMGSAEVGAGGLHRLNLLCGLPWKAFSTLFQIPPHFNGKAIEGGASFQVSFEKDVGAEIEVQGMNLKWDHQPLDLFCRFKQEKEAHWKIEPSRIGDFSLEGLFSFSESGLHLKEGRGKWREALEAGFEGRFDSLRKWGINLSSIRLDLSEISPLTSRFGWPLEKIEGTLTGSGVLSWDEKLESDFDFAASHLKAGSLVLENRTPLHLYYSSERGILIRGLDLAVMKPDLALPWLDCKIGLLQYDVEKSLWVLTHSHFHLPSDFFPLLPQELDFVADIECASDFSTLYCSMKEGFIPFKGEMRHLQNLHLFWDSEICTANFDLFYQSQLLKIGLFVDLYRNNLKNREYDKEAAQIFAPGASDVVREQGASEGRKFAAKPTPSETDSSGYFGIQPVIAGRLSVQDELFIDWTYKDQLSVQAIEGNFAGMELSFHPEGETLIGSARIDCRTLSEMVSPQIAKVFQDLKMGKGYELMGRLAIQEEGLSFSGILSGKQLELFDYQLRTLLAQVEITPSQVKIYNLKISDSAGVMKIDEIHAKEEPDGPWTISIPHLTISELRPSLIKRIGKPPGTISPLVIRQLKIDDFKGLLEESLTYTAKGELYFINSYKREHTVFDIPSDVLSRIVGLDLDLLVPVCGTLKYELKDRFFHLTELHQAYSENQRSEFFLVNSDLSPKMDLDGNLNILITMKQFVLFKFTESFLISIEGKLDDPKFHLQKKKRFLGL